MEFMEMVYLALVLFISITYALVVASCILTLLSTNKKVSTWLMNRITVVLGTVMDAYIERVEENATEMDPAEFNREADL
jgi:hypothetical protein